MVNFLIDKTTLLAIIIPMIALLLVGYVSYVDTIRFIQKDVLLKADKSRIDEVISNLLSNAIKFTPEGTITISVEKDETKNWVIVRVTDTGQGIDISILPRLFTKFVSRSYQGTGLIYSEEYCRSSYG